MPVGRSAHTRPDSHYTFTGVLGQQLIYDALTNDPPAPNLITATLFNPQGVQEGPIGGSRFSYDRGPFALQQSGTYTLMIDGNGSGVGPFAFRLLDVSAQPVLPISAAVTNTLDVYPLLVYRYAGAAGQPLYFRGHAGNPGGNWTLYDPNDNAVSGSGGGLAGDFQVTLPVNGTYALLLSSYSTTAGTEVFQVNPFNSGETLTANLAPVLNHIGNQSVPAGVTVVFTAQATDPDNDTLTFSLDPGSPAGATINPSTGAFSWTPPSGLPSVTPVTVRVTDNGTPSLSAAETISIQVGVIAGLQMITVQLAPGTATPSWHSTVGKHYRLEYKNNLQDPTWTAVGADVAATDVITSQVDSSIGNNTTRFYRVQQLTP